MIQKTEDGYISILNGNDIAEIALQDSIKEYGEAVKEWAKTAHKIINNMKCEFCDKISVAKVGVQIDEDGIRGKVNVCKEHLTDYDDREGIFEQVYE